MRVEIAPCRKCGGTGVTKLKAVQGKIRYYVHCINCGEDAEPAEDIEKAKELWNNCGQQNDEDIIAQQQSEMQGQADEAEALLNDILNM